jgi:hypothetical protein
MACTPLLEWHVQFHKGGTACISWFATPEQAIEAACTFIDEGDDVYGIGTGSLDDSIKKDQVARIYAMWVKAKAPFAALPPVQALRA